MRGGKKPEIRTVKKGKNVVTQGEAGNELFLVLNGVVTVLVDDNAVAELGPGAVLGERAVLEGGTRTSTVQALTDVKVAVASPDQIDRDALVQLSEGHKREQ
jgi:CRP-like cAMP-binding protein